MNLEPLRSALHIVLGGSAAGILNQTLHLFRDRRLLIGEDPLAWGPAPATNDLDLWRATREPFLDQVERHPGRFSFVGYAEVGLLMNATRLREEKEFVVWAGTGLPDQLNLAWTVFLCDQYAIDLAKLRVIQFEWHKSWPVYAMGELNPDIIRDHFPPPRGLTASEANELRMAWQVYTSGDPADLARYAARSSPLPLLHEAMSALLLRYPDRRSGLGIVDESLLRFVKKVGPNPARIVAETMGRNDGPDRLNYQYLFWRLLRMGALDTPLVTVGGRVTVDFGIEFLKRANAPRMMSEAEITLTPFGESVLAGEANAVRENGIDDWIGGVHLIDAERPPFREDYTLLLG